MEMSEQLASNVLWLTALLGPAFIFLATGPFPAGRLLWPRALGAVGLGWILWLAYAVAAQSLSDRLENGAALAFVSVFGWVAPMIVVAIAWAVVAYVRKRGGAG